MSSVGCPFTITPYSTSGIINNPPVNNIDYTNQDFWSMKTRLINFINERFGPNGTELPNTFSDLVEGDIAIMLIENFAFLADLLSFKIDQTVNELFIDTVTQIENAFRISELVGFQPLPPIGASAMFVATINNPILTNINIPTPVSINISSGGITTNMELFAADSNNNPIFNQNIIIPAGQTINQSIIGIEGSTRIETFSGNGQPSQIISLSFNPVIYGSISIMVNGLSWNLVEYFTDSQPRPEYMVQFDSNWDAYIIFGNNQAGLIPTNGSLIQITYRIGGGIAGNIVSGYVNTQIMTIVPGLEFSVPINVTNYTSGTNGYAGDTVDDIRRKLPLYLSTQNRAVSGSDYQILADQFATPYNGQVGKSVAVLRNFGCAGNIIDIYILALSGTNDLAIASNELKVALNDQLVAQGMMTDFICIKDGSILTVDLNIEVTLDKFYQKFETEMSTNITNIINTFFDLDNWEYGETLQDTDIIKALSVITQIEECVVTLSTDDINNEGTIVTTSFNEIISPDQINISFTYT